MAGEKSSLKTYQRISLSCESLSADGKGSLDYYLNLVFMQGGQGWMRWTPAGVSLLLAGPRDTFIFSLWPSGWLIIYTMGKNSKRAIEKHSSK